MPDLIDLKLRPLIPSPEQQIQTETARLELGEKQRAIRDQQQLRGILTKYGGDFEKALPEITKISPTLGLSVRNSIYEAQTHQFAFERARLQHQADLAGMMGRLAGSVDGPESYNTFRQVVFRESPQDAARLPLTWDDASTPHILDGIKRAALTAEQQFQADEKRAADKRAEQEAERKAARDFAIEQGRQAAAARAESKPIAVSPGTVLVDPKTFQPVAGGPRPMSDAKPGSFEDYTLRYAKDKGKTVEDLTTADIEDARKRYQQADDRPRVNVSVAGGDLNNVKEAIAGMKDGTIPPQMPGRASKDYTAIMAEAHRQRFDLAGAATDWAATQKHISTLNNAQQTRLNQAINQLPELLDSVDALATKWKGGRFAILNSANLKLAKNGVYGQAAASIANQLDAQIADVTADLGNVYMGGNSPTDHALSLAAKSLNASWDEKTLHDMTALARQNVTTRRNSIRNTGVQGASENNPYAPPSTTTNVEKWERGSDGKLRKVTK